jgi:hypothetical protein
MDREMWAAAQAQNNYGQQLGLQQQIPVPPQPSVARTLDNSVDMLQRAVAAAKQIDGNLNGFRPEEAGAQGQGQLSSIYERAMATENLASNLSAILEGILQRL